MSSQEEIKDLRSLMHFGHVEGWIPGTKSQKKHPNQNKQLVD